MRDPVKRIADRPALKAKWYFGQPTKYKKMGHYMAKDYSQGQEEESKVRVECSPGVCDVVSYPVSECLGGEDDDQKPEEIR